jgi:hypothetical protein
VSALRATWGRRPDGGGYLGALSDQPDSARFESAGQRLLWTCPAAHVHATVAEAITCATAELARREAEGREPDQWRRQLAPDLWIVLDSSLCIVLEVTDPAGHVLRRVTVTNAMAMSAVLTAAQSEQRARLNLAAEKRLCEVTEARAASAGLLTRPRAIDKLVGLGRARVHAVSAVNRAEATADEGPELIWTPRGYQSVSYEGGFWRIDAHQAAGSSPDTDAEAAKP